MKIKKNYLLTGCLALAFTSMTALSGSETSQAEKDIQFIPSQSEPARAKHIFWRVSSPTATVYLLGSLHMRPDTPLRLPEIVKKSFESANYVGFEADISQKEKMKKELADYSKKHFYYSPNDSLEKHLEPSVWLIVRTRLRNYDFPEESAIHLKPVFLSITLTYLKYQKDGLKAEKGIDDIFLRMAQAENKKVFGMELWWEPLQAFENLNDKDQSHWLLSSLKDADNTIKIFNDALMAWKEGDTSKLEFIIDSGDRTPKEKN